MENKKVICIDYDSTLVDFETPFFAKISEISGIDINQDNRHLHKDVIKEHTRLISKGVFNSDEVTFFEELYSKIEFFEGAIDFLKVLKRSGYEIKVVTSSMGGQKAPKMEHIEKHIIELIDEVIPARKKFKYTKDSIFIDDNLGHVGAHVENHTDDIGILFNFNNIQTNDTEKLSEYGDNDNFYIMNDFQSILNHLNIKIKINSKNTFTKKKYSNATPIP